MSTPTPGRGCEVELIALCSQKTDPIPVCYTLNGVSQTIYAVLKHPHKGAPTVGFMLPDFTSFDATTGGTFAVGACPLPVVDRFVNPVHWCVPGSNTPGRVRASQGYWVYAATAPDSWEFSVTAQQIAGLNTNYNDPDIINNWYANGTSPTFTYTYFLELTNTTETITLTRSEIASVTYQPGVSVKINGTAPTNINPNPSKDAKPNEIAWGFQEALADIIVLASCKEGKALYTRDAQNQVKLDGVITLDGVPVVVDPLILKEGACAATDCAAAAPVQKAFSSGTITGAFTVPAGAHSVELSLNGTGSVAVTGEVNATFAWAGSARKWTAPEGQAWAQAFNFSGTGNTSYEVNYII